MLQKYDRLLEQRDKDLRTYMALKKGEQQYMFLQNMNKLGSFAEAGSFNISGNDGYAALQWRQGI